MHAYPSFHKEFDMGYNKYISWLSFLNDKINVSPSPCPAKIPMLQS